MKKYYTLLLCLLSSVVFAEDLKIALLQPRITEGSDQCKPMELNMIRGELRKAFGWQSEFQVLTRTDVDAMLNEHGFQSSGMVDDEQRKQVGIMTGAQYICVSTVTKDGTQMYIEAYLVNIETGQMTHPATRFINVKDGDYSTLQSPCNELAKEMLGELVSTPNKSHKIENLDKLSHVEATYVNLGLPSGTLWKSENEDVGLISNEQAMLFYGSNLPTKLQWEELRRCCIWMWTGNGYNVTGASKESIFLPASGYKICSGSTYYVGTYGYYWSSTPNTSDSVYRLYFNSGGVEMGENISCFGYSIRLVR